MVGAYLGVARLAGRSPLALLHHPGLVPFRLSCRLAGRGLALKPRLRLLARSSYIPCRFSSSQVILVLAGRTRHIILAPVAGLSHKSINAPSSRVGVDGATIFLRPPNVLVRPSNKSNGLPSPPPSSVLPMSSSHLANSSAIHHTGGRGRERGGATHAPDRHRAARIFEECHRMLPRV